jgi:molecular chaperone DnaK (HSP70)
MTPVARPRRPIERIAETIDETLRLAGLGADRIETLILTGGSTQIPAIMARTAPAVPRRQGGRHPTPSAASGSGWRSMRGGSLGSG